MFNQRNDFLYTGVVLSRMAPTVAPMALRSDGVRAGRLWSLLLRGADGDSNKLC